MTQEGESRLESAVVALSNRVEELSARIETLDVVTRGRMAEMADQRRKDRRSQIKWRRALLSAIARRLTGHGETLAALEAKVKRFRSNWLRNKQTILIVGAVAAVILGIIVLMIRPEILPGVIQALRGAR